MTLILQILFLVVIGALIGGITNSLAIKMLFRPYHPVYIGKWRLPFTPGLIPKRRRELAVQLGKLVMTHLLTPESVQRKFNHSGFQNEMSEWAQDKIGAWLQSDKTVGEWLHEQFGVNGFQKMLDSKVEDYVEKQLHDLLRKLEGKKVEEAVPTEMLEKAEEYIPVLSDYIVKQGADFFRKQKGKDKLKTLIDQFLEGRGMITNMVQMFLGNENLVEKIQAEVVKLLEKPVFREAVGQLLQDEWEKLRTKDVSELRQLIDEGQMVQEAKTHILSILPTSNLADTPVNELVGRYGGVIVDRWVPRMVQWSGNVISEHLEEAMHRLKLQDIVQEQVETFAVERLEEIVLTISRREFKMITYLGALLGGIIGLVQAVLLQFL